MDIRDQRIFAASDKQPRLGGIFEDNFYSNSIVGAYVRKCESGELWERDRKCAIAVRKGNNLSFRQASANDLSRRKFHPEAGEP